MQIIYLFSLLFNNKLFSNVYCDIHNPCETLPPGHLNQMGKKWKITNPPGSKNKTFKTVRL